jgi:hypothetical protein
MILLGYFDMIKIKAVTVATIQKEQHKKNLQTFRTQAFDTFLKLVLVYFPTASPGSASQTRAGLQDNQPR